MGLREVVQSNQSITAVVALVVIVGCIVWAYKGQRTVTDSLPESVYFYDLGSGELFPAKLASQPPIDAPGGAGKGVKAEVYACGECSPSSRNIAYLTTYTPEAIAAKAKMAEASRGAIDHKLSEEIEKGTLLALPPKDGGTVQWVSATSNAGANIVIQAGKLCGSDPAKSCLP